MNTTRTPHKNQNRNQSYRAIINPQQPPRNVLDVMFLESRNQGASYIQTSGVILNINIAHIKNGEFIYCLFLFLRLYARHGRYSNQYNRHPQSKSPSLKS